MANMHIMTIIDILIFIELLESLKSFMLVKFEIFDIMKNFNMTDMMVIMGHIYANILFCN